MSEKDHKYIYISIANTLCLMKFSNVFKAYNMDRMIEFDMR